jgi:replicative DNA helicase
MNTPNDTQAFSTPIQTAASALGAIDQDDGFAASMSSEPSYFDELNAAAQAESNFGLESSLEAMNIDMSTGMTSANNQGLSLEHLRLPPHSIEAERCVLGCLLLDNHVYDSVSSILNEKNFYRSEHQWVFRAIVQLIEKSRPADVVTVFEWLQNSGRADDVGGLPYINTLSQSVPSAANAKRYAEIVRERGILRQLAETAEAIAGDCYQPAGREAHELLDAAETKIFAIAEQGGRNQQGFQHLPTVLGGVMKRIDELAHRPEGASDVTGVSCGFKDLDADTSGFQRGDLIIVAGRPSMGKTAFSLNVAENVAILSGLPVAVFSMEMGASQLVARMLASVGGIDAQRLRTGRLQQDDWDKLGKGLSRLETAPIFIDETPGLSINILRANARRQARICGEFGLIVVDYLQLMSAGGSGRNSENRATEISEISRGLKSLAKELNCPVVALSQLNRSLEQRPNKRPIMSDLRESGAIEQDADVILFIYRDEVYDPNSMDKGTAEIIIGKQRNGPTGTVRLTFRKELTRFENHAGGMHNAPDFSSSNASPDLRGTRKPSSAPPPPSRPQMPSSGHTGPDF